MDDNFGTIVQRTYLHSSYVPNTGNGDDALVISEIIENEKGETQPNLRVLNNPKVPFWVTQVAHRVHDEKKEFEALQNLDQYDVYYKDKEREIFKVLNGYYPRFISPNQRRELMQSPYLYGGNITIEARAAISYKKELTKKKQTPHVPTTGFFDIEQSLLPSSYGKLPLMVFVAENKVYLAMKQSFMQEERGGVYTKVTVDDVRAAADEIITPLVEQLFEENKDLASAKGKLPFIYEFFVGETEVEMIRWIFGKMHESKTSFIGIWNLGFDMGEIIRILRENDIPLEEIFADPLAHSMGCAQATYREDKRKVAHFTQKWHWLSATAHFQMIDSMALYSYIRMVDGKEASYALDDILKKFNLGGKLKIKGVEELEGLQTADWHRAMLSKFFVYYALYAMWDGIGLQLLEWTNQDLTAMMLLGDVTPPKFFVNQTIRVTDTLYNDWIKKGYVLGTGVDVEGIRDDDLLTEGGAVLEPQNIVATGLKLFKEWPSHATHCYAWQSDFDFSAQYPSNILGMNISKQTKVATMLTITSPSVNKRYQPDEAVEVFCSYMATPKASGVDIGVEFFGLPNYTEMNELFTERLSQTKIAA